MKLENFFIHAYYLIYYKDIVLNTLDIDSIFMRLEL